MDKAWKEVLESTAIGAGSFLALGLVLLAGMNVTHGGLWGWIVLVPLGLFVLFGFGVFVRAMFDV